MNVQTQAPTNQQGLGADPMQTGAGIPPQTNPVGTAPPMGGPKPAAGMPPMGQSQGITPGAKPPGQPPMGIPTATKPAIPPMGVKPPGGMPPNSMPGTNKPPRMSMPSSKPSMTMPIIISVVISLLLSLGGMYAYYYLFISKDIEDLDTKITNVDSELDSLRNRMNDQNDSVTTDDTTGDTTTSTDSTTMTKTDIAALFTDVATWVVEDPSTTTPTTTCTNGSTVNPANMVYSMKYEVNQEAGEDYTTFHDNTKQVVESNGWELCMTETPAADTPGAQTSLVYKKGDMHLFFEGAYSQGAGSSVNVQFEYSE